MTHDDIVISLIIISIFANMACFIILASIAEEIYAIVKHKVELLEPKE